MTRDISLAIGVASAPHLPYLGGAVNGARTFHEWASKVGYDSTLLTDEDAPVTIPRLGQVLESMLDPANAPIHRMLIYFAGHGLIREVEEGLWLLSDWFEAQRAVAVEVLKRRLHRHSIQQIAIFSDSCRSLPPDIDAADLVPDAVLGRGPVNPPKPPRIDKFIAAQDGAATFMVPGANPEDDRCIFTGVLMEGLWGKNPAAFSKLLKDKVTSRSLGEFLDVEVPKRAEVYKRKLAPTVNPTFPEGDDIYFYSGSGVPPTPPVFPDWPTPESVAAMGVRGIDGRSKVSEEVVPPPEAPQSPSFSLLTMMRAQPRPQAFETGAGFAVDGAQVRAVWTTPDVNAERHGQSNWWRLRQEASHRLRKPAPALIEFNDGTFAAVTALPDFIATVLRDERGVSALIYRRIYAERDTAEIAEKAIAMMESGALRVGDVNGLAVELRERKHADPVLGVISAYLYDSIGDLDNIRRVAFFYVDQNQPIPFDIALLAQIPGEWHDGILWAHVPPVDECAPATGGEQQPSWTYSATPAAFGPVGGMWPWMRQGWPFLADLTEDESTIVAPELIEIVEHLKPGRFTTLGAEGGRRLAEIFNFVKWE